MKIYLDLSIQYKRFVHLERETYKYKSYCPLTTEFGCMRGFYTMKDEDGEIFKVEIPEFPLVLKKIIN